ARLQKRFAEDVVGVEARRQGRVDAPPQHAQQPWAVLVEQLAQKSDVGHGRFVAVHERRPMKLRHPNSNRWCRASAYMGKWDVARRWRGATHPLWQATAWFVSMT